MFSGLSGVVLRCIDDTELLKMGFDSMLYFLENRACFSVLYFLAGLFVFSELWEFGGKVVV